MLVWGPNGSGKSSLLEGLVLLATGRSSRPGAISAAIRRGATRFYLSLRTGDPQNQELELTGGPGERRLRRLDGAREDALAFLRAFPVFAWRSGAEDLILGGPRVRRQLLDRLVLERRPGLARDYLRYRSALESKRVFLGAGGPVDRGELSAWNEMLVTHGLRIAEAREERLPELCESFAARAGRLLRDGPPVEVQWHPGLAAARLDASAWLAEFEAAAPREVQARRPLVGPHRADLEILLGGQRAREIVSGGERKLLGLSLLLAAAGLVAREDLYPLLLLDDLEAELDRIGLERLAGELEEFPSVLATSNRPSAESRIAGLDPLAIGDLPAAKETASELARDAFAGAAEGAREPSRVPPQMDL